MRDMVYHTKPIKLTHAPDHLRVLALKNRYIWSIHCSTVVLRVDTSGQSISVTNIFLVDWVPRFLSRIPPPQ